MFWIVQLFLYVSLSAADEKTLTKFGCRFDDAQYNLKTSWKSPSNQPQWGNEVPPMLFSSSEEFKAFYVKIRVSRRNVLMEDTFNTVDSFIQFHDNFKSSKKEFTTFFRNYDHKYSVLPPADNTIYSVIQAYDNLVKKNRTVKNHFMLGTYDEDVSESMLKALENEKGISSQFRHERIIGILKISINGSLGYVLIDTTHLIDPPPVIMLDEKHDANARRAKSAKERIVTYRPLGNAYIRIDYFNTITKDAKGRNHSREEIYETSVLFIKKSMCSFVQTTEKSALLDPYRSIFKTTRLDEIISMCSVTLVPKNSKSANDKAVKKVEAIHLYEANYNDPMNESSKAYRNIYMEDFENLTADQQDFIKRVSRSLKLGDNGLYERLRKMHEIWKSDQGFVTDLHYWYKTIHVSPHRKYFYEPLWDWVRIQMMTFL